jgi:hypothetical protein
LPPASSFPPASSLPPPLLNATSASVNTNVIDTEPNDQADYGLDYSGEPAEETEDP